MTMYDTAGSINAKIAGSKNPRIAAIGGAMQARTAAVRAATTPQAKLQAFTSSLGSGLKAARGVTPASGSLPPNPFRSPPAPSADANPSQRANRQGFSRIG